MPKRRAIPKRVKAEVRQRQNGLCGCRDKCGAVLPADGKALVEYQHEPSLSTRVVLPDDSDWDPPQHDPRYIFAEMAACHRRETHKGRSGATRIGSDRHSTNKVKWIRGEFKGKPKRAWPKGKKIQSRPFQRRKP